MTEVKSEEFHDTEIISCEEKARDEVPPSEVYFEQYEDIEIHRLMLEDKPRTLAYKNAILKNRARIEGKVVLDVGSGTGILSIFCAQVGAKKVHAVEASKMAILSKLIIEENNFSDVIQVHHCLLEDLELTEKVDVIVSEWMGFYLFHEGMLDTVIEARDQFLKHDGLIIPESADLWVAPCELPKYFDYWSDVFGVKMESLGKHDRTSNNAPLVTEVKEQDIIAEESVVKTVDLSSVTSKELDEFQCKTLVAATREGKFQGLCIWFVCNFPYVDDEIIALSTHPSQPLTHWKQIAIVFPFELPVEKGDPIAFHLNLKRRLDDRRKYKIELTMLDPEKEEHPTPCSCNMTRCIVIQKYLEQAVTANDLEDCSDIEDVEDEDKSEERD